MTLTNDSYTILISGKAWTERYSRDQTGWVKESARGRKFRATAEQVLNHLLPALAGIKPGLRVRVEHHEPIREKQRGGNARRGGPASQSANHPVG
jgi:hypothetical protein